MDERKVKNPGTKSHEMVKSACRENLCWCYKLCAFSTEIRNNNNNNKRICIVP